MPSQTTLNVTFNKPSNTGAAGVDNYKIYKGVTYATATNLIYDTASDTGWSGFQDPEVYTDTSLAQGDVVTYKIEFIRSSDGATQEQVVGPYLVPGSSDIGYPNNQPSNTSGFPYFVNTEPLCHFRADSEYGTHGDHLYGDTVIRNQAASYSDFSVNGYNMRVKLWTKPDGTQTTLPILTNVTGTDPNTFGGVTNIYNDNINVPGTTFDKKNLGNYIANPTYNTNLDYTPLHQIYSKIGIPHSNMNEILDASKIPFVLDQGVTTFSVICIKADPLDAATGAPSNNTSLRYPEDWHGTWASLHPPFYTRQPAYTSGTAGAQRARKWSDGDLWVDPAPPFGISNTMDPGYLNTAYPVAACGHQPYIYRSGDARNIRMDGTRNGQLGDALTPFLSEINKLHFVVTRQNGDGTNNTVWIDGKLIYHQDLSAVFVDGVSVKWAASSANLADPAFQAWLDEIDRFKNSDPAASLHAPFVGYPAVGLVDYPLGRAFQSTFAENMIFDQTLSNAEMYRTIFYFQNKFKDYLAPQEGSYNKL